MLKRRILSVFLVTYEDVLSCTNLKEKTFSRFAFGNFVKHFKFFHINVLIVVTLNLVLRRAFLSMCFVWLQLWPSRYYAEWIPDNEKEYDVLDHQGYHNNQDGV